jgi:hypothetical protein
VKLLTVLLLASLITSSAFGRSSRGDKGLVEPTVCGLVEQPKRFANSNVRVKAVVESDLIEHIMLVDTACPAKGVSLWIPHELDDSEVQTLQAALRAQWTPRRRTTDTQVRAVFTGVFLYEHKKRFFKVSQVEHVEVAPPTD